MAPALPQDSSQEVWFNASFIRLNKFKFNHNKWHELWFCNTVTSLSLKQWFLNIILQCLPFVVV